MGRFGLVGVVGWSLTLVCGGWAAGQQAPIETSILNVDFGDVELRVAGDVFSDVRLRMMLLHAVDWRSLPGAQVVWFGDERVDHLATPHDRTRASALLWEAGWATGFGIEIWSDRDALVVAEGLRSYLVAIGVSAEVRAASDDQLRQRLAELARTGGRGIVVLSAQSSASATVPRPVAPDVRADDRVSVDLPPTVMEITPPDVRRPVGQSVSPSSWQRSQPVEFALFGRLWDDPRLRLMLRHAIDWRQIEHYVTIRYGYRAELLSTAGFAHNPHRAVELLAETGWLTDFRVTLVVLEGGASIGHAAKSHLDRVGVVCGEVDVVSEEVLDRRLPSYALGDSAVIVIRSRPWAAEWEPNRIERVRFDPPSPAELRFNERVTFTFDYVTSEPEGVRVWGRPLTSGQPSSNYAAHGSSLFPKGQGRASGYFTITAGAKSVDQVRLRMVNADGTTVSEHVVDVRYVFR